MLHIYCTILCIIIHYINLGTNVVLVNDFPEEGWVKYCSCITDSKHAVCMEHAVTKFNSKTLS